MEIESAYLTDTFSPEEYLINIVRRAVLNSQNILIDTPNHGHITLFSSDGEYFSDVENPEEFCRLPASSFKVTVLNEAKLKAYKTGIGRNLDELLWQVGFYASNGRLMEGCMWNDVVELSHWPNFTRVPVRPSFLRLAAILAKQATSLEYCITLLKISRQEAYQFYTAAISAGAVRVVNRPPKQLNLKPHRNQALLGLLLEKIAQI